ncbi:MAG: ABC transporter permease [Clostridia bacterium]|nr:ABC transporter permease [Clostridia bacterium]
MTKYLVNRILRGLLSIILVVAIVMIMVYSFLDRSTVFASDPNYSHLKNNAKTAYMYQRWERYGYLDYVPYGDYLQELLRSGELTQEEYESVAAIGDTAEMDSEAVAAYIEQFTEYYESQGYEVERLPAKYKPKTVKYHDGGEPRLFAYKDVPLISRLWTYLTGIFEVDSIHYVEEDIADRGLTFTLYDPVYGGEKFSPAIMGNGTLHKYLLYFDSTFPYIHQNLLTINLGTSYTVNQGVDVFDTMTQSQGAFKNSLVTYPAVDENGNHYQEESADNLHSAIYVAGSFGAGNPVVDRLYVDDYTNVQVYKNGMSKMGYSFVIGIISVAVAYCLGVPLGMLMARKKDKLFDKIGTLYIVFIIAVPSLAYIFMFKALGDKLNASAGKAVLPTTFDMTNPTWLMYILPIISLALPSIANLMKWLRRYMIDQMNSDYVKFARSGGLSEGEIFRKHVLKNAIIPIVHGIPGSVLGSLVGAIITERVYVVPGAGNLLTEAINKYDNGVIVGVTLFYATLSVVSIILGDILMSLVDPRISFTTKRR